MPIRWGLVVWMCAGALGLGIAALEANRRRIPLGKSWFFYSLLLGPIFLCFILPLWLGRWGRPPRDPR